jgi:soluble lytic murein transglycosylase-like protein
MNGLYKEILYNIQSNFSYDVTHKFIPNYNNSSLEKLVVNDKNDFNTVLDKYINNNTSSNELDSAINEAIVSASKKYSLDPNLIKAVIRTESNFNPNAVSSSGAMGLMQLMPKTSDSLGVNNPFSVYDNVSGGSKYLKEMLDRFDNDEKLALAAYNSGPGTVEKYNGVPPYLETQNYVPKVLSYKEQYILGEYNKNK